MPVRRKYSFKKSFLTQEVLDSQAYLWSTFWQQDYIDYKAGHILPSEFCARIVLLVHKTLFLKKWHNGKRSEVNQFEDHSHFYALNALSKYKVRALPEAAAQALLRWAKGQITLKVFEALPDAFEVLQLQTRGIRCVSVIFREQDIRTFRHEGRDFYSFLIHDLIHAQLMTQNAESFENQMCFAKMIGENWKLLTEGGELGEKALFELEYLASDMNSHIAHLELTLKSWLQRHRPDLLVSPGLQAFRTSKSSSARDLILRSFDFEL